MPLANAAAHKGRAEATSKLPVREVKQPQVSPRLSIVLAFVQGFLPLMIAVIGGLWAVFTYLENQKAAQRAVEAQQERDNVTRLIEARKPFLSLHLERYAETAKIIGQLLTLDFPTPNNAEWRNGLHPVPKTPS
jgi:hypothetical protein